MKVEINALHDRVINLIKHIKTNTAVLVKYSKNYQAMITSLHFHPRMIQGQDNTARGWATCHL